MRCFMKIFGDYKKNEYDNLFFDELENKLKDVNKDICIYLLKWIIAKIF